MLQIRQTPRCERVGRVLVFEESDINYVGRACSLQADVHVIISPVGFCTWHEAQNNNPVEWEYLAAVHGPMVCRGFVDCYCPWRG